MKKIFVWLLALVTVLALVGCEVDGSGSKADGSKEDISRTKEAANELQANQPTPTDIEYSLERYNLIRRAYWVNGQREKADALPCEVAKPLGYVVLLTEGGSVVGRFTVDGKVSSLNSFLTPGSVDSTYGNSSGGYLVSPVIQERSTGGRARRNPQHDPNQKQHQQDDSNHFFHLSPPPCTQSPANPP